MRKRVDTRCMSINACTMATKRGEDRRRDSTERLKWRERGEEKRKEEKQQQQQQKRQRKGNRETTITT